MVEGYLKDNPVKDGKDINAMMREIMSVILKVCKGYDNR